ncbi:Vacuole membrane protein 1 [Hypsibius exemplaris]|uniref:Vacuole membrane protein 1 n=1 Tax=Hypsibius exemplaris TaxID=2072580 RepID=A0A1W0X2E2_HYPEX|nr:Vacuole membrane protein 1 [Hypsibius exemplaris]
MTKTSVNGVTAEAPVTRSRSRQILATKETTAPKTAESNGVLKGGKRRKNKMKANGGEALISVSSSDLSDYDSSKGLNNGAGSHLALPVQSSLSDKVISELGQHAEEDKEFHQLTLWRSPFKTVRYFLLEVLSLLHDYGSRLARTSILLPLVAAAVFLVVTYNVEGVHQTYVGYLERKLITCLYWIGLGVLSSIGLGTGLHTFILYLGPHIASVTLAAYECGTLNFPEPPYPEDIICPDGLPGQDFQVTMWSIMSKVRLESFMWGLGTAIGELPPYFMARAARLSGKESEELLEVKALLEQKMDNQRLTLMQRAKVFMEQLVARVGFLGILLGASIPNPLFDLAGITCGHFLVPFGTFFGATLLGKAVIKMHIQMIFVIITFSERHVEHLISLFNRIPRVGPYMERPFVDFLEKQKKNLHRRPGVGVHQSDPSWLQFVFEKLVICMVIYFVLSIVHSLAQNYYRRLRSQKKQGKRR